MIVADASIAGRKTGRPENPGRPSCVKRKNYVMRSVSHFFYSMRRYFIIIIEILKFIKSSPFVSAHPVISLILPSR